MNRLIELDYHYSKDLQQAFDDIKQTKLAYDYQRMLEELDAFMDTYFNYDIVLGYYDNNTETFMKETVLNDDNINALMDITSANIIDKLLDYHENFVYAVDACVRIEAYNSILTVEYNGYELKLDCY